MECTVTWTGHSGTRSGMGFVAETGSGHVLNMDGAPDPARVAWQAGLVATLSSGVIELAAAFVAERVRKATPRAALLSTLAGIAVGFISFGFLFRAFARPIVGLTTFGVVMLIDALA